MQSIGEKLLSLEPREIAGPDVYRRFQFQIAAALETIIELAKKKEDFYALIDHFDDFVVVTEEGTPYETITFYQVKTKDTSAITISTVIKHEWLVHMGENVTAFLEHDVKSILLTNCGISWNKKLIQDTVIIPLCKFLDVDKHSEEVKEQMKAHFGEGYSNQTSRLYLLRTTLPLDANTLKTQIMGKMQEFALCKYPMLSIHSIAAIYQKVWSEMTLKQSQIFKPSADIKRDELMKSKAFSKKQLNTIFAVMCAIQVPTKKEISTFISQGNIYIGNISFLKLLDSYDDYVEASMTYGKELQEEAFNYLNSHKDLFLSIENQIDVGKKLVEIMNGDTAICSTEFYRIFKYWIGVHYLYKFING